MKPLSNKTEYRPDIDALRALAVGVVLLFHGGVPFASGGFIGVDVFFVISGFLITSIISNQLQKGTFSLTSFYLSRVRRLFPALLVLVVVIASLSYTLTLYNSLGFTAFRHSARSALLFYSNIFFYLNTGYFDAPAITQVFLHTWSLGVEAQYYLLYPFMLLLIHKKWSKNAATILLFSTIGLYLFSSIYVHFYPNAGFYLFPFRAWELLLGGWLALSKITPKQQKTKEGCILLGVFLILFSTIIFNNLFIAHTPGMWSLLPCAGAALIISGGSSFSRQGFTHSLIRNKSILHVGLISYSLYLWHWPIFVIYQLVSFETHISFLALLSLLLLTFLCAHYSWKYIEQPIRKKSVAWPSKKQVLVFGCCLLVSLLPTKLIKKPHIFFINADYARAASDYCALPNMALLGSADKAPQFLVFGDSHAQAIAGFFDKMGHETGVSGRLFTSDCLINGRRARSSDYQEFNELFKDTISQEKYSTVFLASRWALGVEGHLPHESTHPLLDLIGFVHGEGSSKLFAGEAMEASLVDTITYLRQHGANNIYIFLPVPECRVNIPSATSRLGFLPIAEEKINKEFGVPLTTYTERNKEVIQILHRIKDRFPFVGLLDPTPLFYGDGDISKVVNNGKGLYYDDDHISVTGSYLLRPLIENLPPFYSK